MILMGRTKGIGLLYAILIQCAWVIFLGVAAKLIWTHSLRRMKVMGG
jgi:ABC-type uncharacterized transport system permease subunit